MHTRTKIRLSAISIAIMIIAIIAITQKGFAWTNPTANPPVSTSVITTSGGNLGVGVATPLVKLHVNGSVRGDQAGALRIDSGNGTLDVGAMNASYAHFQTDRPNFYFNKSVSVDGALSNYAGRYYLAQSGISYLNGGAVGIGTTSPDANYKITTTGGGIKAENSSATQPAGYFSNAGGGPAVIIGTGGITLGGVNQTAWPTTGLGGSGTANYLAKFTAGTTMGNSSVYDAGTNVGIGTTDPAAQMAGTQGIGIYKNAYPAVGFKNDTSSWLLYGNGATFRLWNVSAGEVMAVNTSGKVGFGTTAPDANYRITTSGGGIKAENSSATQPAGYFSNAGGGPAITAGTGGITLGGVNKTSWPAGADNLGNHTATAALNMSGNDITALRNLTLSGAMTPGSVGVDSGLTGARHYQFGYQEGGAWTHPYPDLVVGYHTGLKLGANSGYGGTRFYNDHPSVSSTELMSVGNGDNHVRIANNLYVTGAITAGAGGITLGGVNKTSWPSGTDDTKVLKAGDTMTGNLRFGSVGLGSVGVYDPTKTQAVWSMGPAYVLPAGGGTTSYGTLYGLGWSYNPDYSAVGNNPQSKAGLNHQLLVMNNAVTQTAIGTGIWTNGNITSVGSAIINGGSSSNWASVNAPTFNAGTSIYSYGSICTGNTSGTCGGSGGTVIGTANTSAVNNIPNSGNVIFNNGSNMGIGTATPDANYRLTTSGGGIKAENSSATQPAGYFSNAGGGPAVIIGTGGITLGGVNQTAWPSGGGAAGACGTANEKMFLVPPTTGLCSVGTASAMIGSGPWNWLCSGSSIAVCSAKVGATKGTVSWSGTSNAYYQCALGGYSGCLRGFRSTGAMDDCYSNITGGTGSCTTFSPLATWSDTSNGYYQCALDGYSGCEREFSSTGAMNDCYSNITGGKASCTASTTSPVATWAGTSNAYYQCALIGYSGCVRGFDSAGAMYGCFTNITGGTGSCKTPSPVVSWSGTSNGYYQCALNGYTECVRGFDSAGAMYACTTNITGGKASCVE